MITETLHLEPGAGREDSINRMLDYAMRLPKDKRFTLDIEEWRAPLPENLRARIKIVVRALAKFHGLTYDEMNEIVHDRYYPKRSKSVAGVEYRVSLSTNELHPDEARQIEADLRTLAGQLGCPIPEPKGQL